MIRNWRNADTTRLASVYPDPSSDGGFTVQIFERGTGYVEYNIPRADLDAYAAAIQGVIVESNSARWAQQQRAILRVAGIDIASDPPTWRHDAQMEARNRWP